MRIVHITELWRSLNIISSNLFILQKHFFSLLNWNFLFLGTEIETIIHALTTYSSIQFCSVVQSCPTLCDPMDCNTLGLLVHHQLPELVQTHVYWVSDAIQPFHPLLPPSFPAFTTYIWLLNCSLMNYLLKENRKHKPTNPLIQLLELYTYIDV